MRAAGFPVLGTDHHRHTFEALRVLDLGELGTLAREMNAFRRSRHQAIYDWDHTPPDDPAAPNAATELAELGRTVRRMLDLGQAWLVENRPAVAHEFHLPDES